MSDVLDLNSVLENTELENTNVKLTRPAPNPYVNIVLQASQMQFLRLLELLPSRALRECFTHS
jgi:hypothetical protein